MFIKLTQVMDVTKEDLTTILNKKVILKVVKFKEDLTKVYTIDNSISVIFIRESFEQIKALLKNDNFIPVTSVVNETFLLNRNSINKVYQVDDNEYQSYVVLKNKPEIDKDNEYSSHFYFYVKENIDYFMFYIG